MELPTEAEEMLLNNELNVSLRVEVLSDTHEIASCEHFLITRFRTN